MLCAKNIKISPKIFILPYGVSSGSYHHCRAIAIAPVKVSRDSRVAQSSPWYPISQMQKASSPGPVQMPLWLHQFGHLPRADGSRPSSNSMPQKATRDEARKLIPAAVCSAIAIWRIAGPKATDKCQWVRIAYSQGSCCLCCCSRAAELQLTSTTNLLCVKASARRKNGFLGERLAFLYRDKYKASES